jgi:hypothetical protein
MSYPKWQRNCIKKKYKKLNLALWLNAYTVPFCLGWKLLILDKNLKKKREGWELSIKMVIRNWESKSIYSENKTILIFTDSYPFDQYRTI